MKKDDQRSLLDAIYTGFRPGDMRPMRTTINKLRHKLGGVGARPTYIFTEHRIEYLMPGGGEGSSEQ